LCETGIASASPMGITFGSLFGLWITQGLCQNCAQGLQDKPLVLSFKILFKKMFHTIHERFGLCKKEDLIEVKRCVHLMKKGYEI
jgi:hypothetical protein